MKIFQIRWYFIEFSLLKARHKQILLEKDQTSSCSLGWMMLLLWHRWKIFHFLVGDSHIRIKHRLSSRWKWWGECDRLHSRILSLVYNTRWCSNRGVMKLCVCADVDMVHTFISAFNSDQVYIFWCGDNMIFKLYQVLRFNQTQNDLIEKENRKGSHMRNLWECDVYILISWNVYWHQNKAFEY